MESNITKRSRLNADNGIPEHQNPTMKESEWGRVMVSKSEKSTQSNSITSRESTESITPENCTDSNSSSDDGLSSEPSRNVSNGDFQTFSLFKFVEGESIILPPLSQLHSTHISSLLEVPSSQDSVSVDNKLHALQKVLQQSGVEIADNSPAAILAATYDYIVQLKASSQQFEEKLKHLQVALDKHDDVVCQAILKNVQIDVMNRDHIEINTSTVLSSGTVDRDLYFIEPSEDLVELLQPSSTNLIDAPRESFSADDSLVINLLNLVENDYRDCLRAKLNLMAFSIGSSSVSSSSNTDGDSDILRSSSPVINPIYIYVTSKILTPHHGLGKRNRPCVLRITAFPSVESLQSSPQSESTSFPNKVPTYSVTIYSA